MGKHVGSALNDFLDEEGLLAEVEAVAVKRVIAYQLGEMMKEQGLSKTGHGLADSGKYLHLHFRKTQDRTGMKVLLHSSTK